MSMMIAEEQMQLPRGVICDLEGFLVDKEAYPLEGVIEGLANLRQLGIPLVLAINLPDPLYRCIQDVVDEVGLEGWKRGEYRTTTEVVEFLDKAHSALALDVTPIYIAVYDPKVKKLPESFLKQMYSRVASPETLAEVIAGELHVNLAHAGIPAYISTDPMWFKPGYEMVHAAHREIEEQLGKQAIPYKHVIYMASKRFNCLEWVEQYRRRYQTMPENIGKKDANHNGAETAEKAGMPYSSHALDLVDLHR